MNSWVIRIISGPLKPFKQLLLGALLAGVLAGCSFSTSSIRSPLLFGCLPEREELLEGIDWAAVGTIRMGIISDNFRPMVFHFESGRPYVLEIINYDDSTNNIWAPGFLKNGVALNYIKIGDGQPTTGCVNGIRIKPDSKIRIKFVAAHEGRYEVHNTAIPIIPGQIPDGVFYVDPPRLGVVEN